MRIWLAGGGAQSRRHSPNGGQLRLPARRESSELKLGSIRRRAGWSGSGRWPPASLHDVCRLGVCDVAIATGCNPLNQEEAVPLKVRSNVKEYQHRLAQLDADHSRAQDRLAAARCKRADVVGEHDRLVTAAEHEVNAAVAAMAAEVGSDVTAALLNIDLRDVRRLIKGRPQPAATPEPRAPSGR